MSMFLYGFIFFYCIIDPSNQTDARTTNNTFMDWINGLFHPINGTLPKILAELFKSVSIKIKSPQNNVVRTAYEDRPANKEKIRDTQTTEDYVPNLSLDLIDLLLKFGPRSLKKCWDNRPDLQTFNPEDMTGKNVDKFLEHINSTRDLYKELIDLCEKLQNTYLNRTIPDHLIVNDLINAADDFDVTIIRNGESRFDVYPGLVVNFTDFTINDLEGTEENKQRFMKNILSPEFKELEKKFQEISADLHGVPLPLHIEAELIIATAKYYNVFILSIGGKTFDMDWHHRQSNYVGYPVGTPGALAYVQDHCFKVNDFVADKLIGNINR